MNTQTQKNTDNNIGGCDNVISFADFVARMAKREKCRARYGGSVQQTESRVIYIGDLR